MRKLCADLHIHTCLSPCAETEMTPSAIVEKAKERGLDVIAICDHNSTENVEAVRQAAGNDLRVIGGMEIASREEVHLLGLFDEKDDLERAQEIVYSNLTGENDPAIFGDQLVVDADGNVRAHNPRMLIDATSLALGEAVRMVHDFNGLAIASHVDRQSFSVVSQLGFVPENLGLDAVEVCGTAENLPADIPVVASSDAHRLDEIGVRRTEFRVEEGTVAEIKEALKESNGRKIVRAR